MSEFHMGQISHPQHKIIAAGDTSDIGPNMIDFNVVLLESKANLGCNNYR